MLPYFLDNFRVKNPHKPMKIMKLFISAHTSRAFEMVY